MDKQERLSSLIADYISKLVAGYVKMNELSASQLYILRLLGTQGDKNCSQIAELLEVSLSAVTNLVNKLVKKGYVKRIIPENNRRIVLLQITDQGLAMLHQSDERYKELSKGLLSDLSDEEVDLLIHVYEKIIAKNHKIKGI